ncbi:arabinan endo-1,5-alpha-L-arabinosidase A [Cordyceps fumosorosea ARSEF 2679]|uniref:Arabinan endo-1,5-alpha-L-arabinosidase A n=1 Tax=Cordyceps fumosorosea (strain ARSEF 2679) TaxID=1081104 RepID=A0A168ARN6_CORFA|nr:arabinan endo-1,5-alpha-L-arabinosidase A [Cordyceps fumosorosea ARSEF 2679]OAA69103.1 arabinan endo-1,5-alpha-L-arabinosidase A [Cordyceps fumosorosea ARSEF 2679]
MKMSGVIAAALLSTSGSSTSIPDYPTNPAGNPFVDGWYADPDNEFYNGEYWVYPTYSREYDAQTFLDAFSSPDLVNWTKHPNILNTTSFPWARRAVWAPAPISRNGKYYLYFAANDIQTDDEVGGIGVGVADRPEGPYRDAIGGPLIDRYHNGAQPIDQDVFIDDADGQAYIYYGGHGHANVARLNDDMVSLGTFPDGDVYKEITPDNYVEGPQMLKRKGRYYLFWSEGGWQGPDYAVSYGIADSPTGPFPRRGKILEQDLAVATGSGHNGIITVPGTDVHYIVYHRHPLGSADGNDRQLAYDRLVFRDDGTVEPVVMGVQDDFRDGRLLGWTTYGGAWDASARKLKMTSTAAAAAGPKAVLNLNFADQHFAVDVAVPTQGEGDAGVVFRATRLREGVDAYCGYYLGIGARGRIVVGRADDGAWTEIRTVEAEIRTNTAYTVAVRAVGSQFDCSVTHGRDVITSFTVSDDKYSHGTNGVRAFRTRATFDNLEVRHV